MLTELSLESEAEFAQVRGLSGCAAPLWKLPRHSFPGRGPRSPSEVLLETLACCPVVWVSAELSCRVLGLPVPFLNVPI